MEFKDKIMLYCFGGVKCQQGFTKGISYDLYKALGVTISMWISGLMVSELDFRDGYLGSFPGKQNYKFTFQFFFLMILMKNQLVGNRRKRFYGEMWENTNRGESTFKNP